MLQKEMRGSYLIVLVLHMNNLHSESRIYCLCFVSLHSVSVIVHLCLFLSQIVLLFLGTLFVNSSVIMTYYHQQHEHISSKYKQLFIL